MAEAEAIVIDAKPVDGAAVQVEVLSDAVEVVAPPGKLGIQFDGGVLKLARDRADTRAVRRPSRNVSGARHVAAPGQGGGGLAPPED